MSLRGAYLDLKTLRGIYRERRPCCGPRIAQVNISENCNLDCVLCNRSSMNVSGLIDGDRLLSLAGELYALGTQELFFHGFGEPTCHPRLAEMILHCSADYPALRLHLITNGAWNSPALDEAIRKGRVRTRFSIHAGDADTWRRIHPRDNPDLFFQTGKNLRRLAAFDPDRVEILYVICSLNVHKIPEMVSYARAHGVKKILFRPMRLFEDRAGRCMNASLQLDAGQYLQAAAAIARLGRQFGSRVRLDSIPFEQSSFHQDLERPSSRAFYESRSCYIGYVLSVIERDGGVWGCLPESSSGKPMGNIFETSFREIWYGEEYAAFRKRQLFRDKTGLDGIGCHSYCQHLDTNLRLNRIKPWRRCRRMFNPQHS